jgi:hypothetical protein
LEDNVVAGLGAVVLSFVLSALTTDIILKILSAIFGIALLLFYAITMYVILAPKTIIYDSEQGDD